MSKAVRLMLGGLAAGLVIWAVSTLGSGGSSERRSGAYPLIGMSPDQVRVLDIEAGATRVSLARERDGGWRAHDGTPTASASLLTESADHLFPFQAYRRLQIDPADPEVGLGAPQFVVRVGDRTGGWSSVSIGAPNFVGAGFYAMQSADRRVYLVSRGTVDILRSLTTGERFHTPRPAKLKAAFDSLERDPDEEQIQPGPWLRQALEEKGP